MAAGVVEARESYEAGEYRRAWDLARTGLDENPEDSELLRIAGDAARELNDADAWRELGDALAAAGRAQDAGEALRRAVELRPDDTQTLLDLVHAVLAAGRPDDALPYLQQVLEYDPQNAGALHALVEVHRRKGHADEALHAARQLAEARPDDPLSAIELADLALELGHLVEAEVTFRRLRAFDDDPEHEVPYAHHGLIEVEIRRENWRRALDLAVDATRVDRLGRTTDILAFVVAQVFGAGERPAPERSEVEAALARSRAEHRRLHAEEAVVV